MLILDGPFLRAIALLLFFLEVYWLMSISVWGYKVMGFETFRGVFGGGSLSSLLQSFKPLRI